jgi:hypothetical protein
MHSHWIAALLICAFLGVRAGMCQDVDGIEFVDVADAKGFGWEVTEDTTLTVTNECEVGRRALKAQPMPDAKPYRGFELLHNFDLTGAGPKDSIVFFVKQNFGRGMRVQLWTEKGGIHRSFSTNMGVWNRVELDLDLNRWEHDKNVGWGKVVRMQFYETSFQKLEHYMILDSLAITVGGKSALSGDPLRALQTWTFPYETNAAWYLGDDATAWVISKSTGQVFGGWNAKTKERYLDSLEGRYHLENRKTLVTGRESADKVVRAEFNAKEQRIEMTCSNPAVPDLTIRKRYWMSGNKLYQRVAFVTAAKDLQFVTYNSEAAFVSAYRNGGYYMGGADGGGPLVPAPQISGWQKVLQYQNTTKGMLLHQPEKGYSFAHMRTHLDDRFVWPYFTGCIASYCEKENILSYTPSGWDMSLGTSRLSTDKETSYTQYLSVFEGDWQTFLRAEYPALPDVQQALREIPPVPAWVADIKMDAGGDMNRLRQMVKATDEGVIVALVCLSGSWADYYVDQGMECGFGGRITGPELREHIRRIKALSPRIKVGMYMWMLSTMDNTRIYKAHPEWFRYGNKDGEPLNTFPGWWTNFAHLLSNPGCYTELLSQFDLAFDYLDLDYIMLDDPKAINCIDWKTGEYTRDDLSFRFMLDIKKIAAKHGPDKMIYFNNRGNPYGDINYIEARDTIRANYWRHLVGISAVIQEFVTATRPDARTCPLYFVPPTRREYMNLTLALGFVPSLIYCDVVASRPFFQAAYEMGNCASVPVRYSPDWKRDKTTNVESYSVQRHGDKGYLLSFNSHMDAQETVPVRVELDSLGLDNAGRVFVWEYTLENALEYEGCATESLVRKVYAQTGWQLDRVTRRKLRYAGPYQKEFSLPLELAPLRLHQLYITTEPAAVYSENSLPANYLFGRMPHVALTSKADWRAGSLEIQMESSRDEAEIMACLPLSTFRLDRVMLDGTPVEPAWVCEGEEIFPVVKTGQGRHVLTFGFAPAGEIEPAQVANLAAAESVTGLSLELPGYDAALVTIEKSGRVLFNRAVKGKAGNLALPVAPVRKESGAYTVAVRAVVDANGRMRPVKGARASVDLSAAALDLGMGPDRNPLEPGLREITPVNRTIKGLEVLNAAIMTTPTTANDMQPGLKMLSAKVQPDDLLFEAGTTRAVLQGNDDLVGAAFASLEIKNLRKVRVRLANTFYNAFHMRGPGFHTPEKPNSRNFAGIVVDYHTPNGYTKRVGLATGLLHTECSSSFPDYGRAAVADEFRDLGKALIEKPEAEFALDLQRYAPKDWDGQVWFSVGSDWTASSRMLTLQILAANDAVTGEALDGVNPKAFREAYEKPRVLQATRSPGGIVIDGIPFEEWWGGAGKTDQFFLYGGEGLSKAKTSAMVLYDDLNLYVAFICHEPDRPKPMIVGGAPWEDDSIEVWIDANKDQTTYRQVIINGVNEKLEYGEAGPTPIGATSAVHVVEGDSWMVEMTIPFKGLGVQPPKPGDSWRISLCRARPPGRANPNSELIVWAPLKAGGFKDLANFGTLTFR